MNFAFGRCKRLMISLLFAALSSTAMAESRPSSLPSTDVCSESARPESYRGAFLKDFKILQKGEQDWLFRDKDLRLAYGPRAKGYRQLQQLQQFLHSRGTALVMVPIPGRALIHPEYLGAIQYDVLSGRQSYSRYLAQLRATDIVVPAIDSLFAQTQSKLLFFARDHHWNHHGARTIARLTASAIRSEDISGIVRQKFTSYGVGGNHVDGSLQQAAWALCQKRYPKEPFKLYQTVPVSNSVADDLLLAELPIAQIVLVGTSNSKGQLQFNFAGFLAHYSYTAVDNKAKSGAGFGGALADYLRSEQFKQSPPKVLVWEIPGYYSLNETAFFDDLLKNLEVRPST